MALTSQQKDLTERQVAAYENKQEVEKIDLTIAGQSIVLEVDPFVATPSIMNSGLQVVKFLEANPDVVEGKTVNDMGTGSGIIGIAAALLGAKKVYMEDIDESAVKNAQRNIAKLNLTGVCEAFVSNLFENYGNREKAEVQIFNHPFMPANPLPGKKWTRMMFGGLEVIGKYFEQAPQFSSPDALYVFPWLALANMDDELDNNPSKRGDQYGFKVMAVSKQEPTKIGIQQYPFEIYSMRYFGMK
jgi:methylase of polypeptide subunit release factors